jgi:hypothetical protein
MNPVPAPPTGWRSVWWLWFLVLGAGCTVIAFNRGPVEVSEKDSHDATGESNRAHTFDVNISPR